MCLQLAQQAVVFFRETRLWRHNRNQNNSMYTLDYAIMRLRDEFYVSH